MQSLMRAAAAEAPGYSPANIEKLRARVRALLAERFGLAHHIESKEMSIFALVVAKGGPKLTGTTTANGPQISVNDRRLTCKKVTMQRFADVVLAGRMGRRVLDKTGLTAEYDFNMEFVPDEGAPKAVSDPPASSELAGPSFQTAMQEQLGLRLEPAKGPVDFLVIDQVQRPSAN